MTVLSPAPTALYFDLMQISAKTLGYLALPDFCPRCFWLKMRLGNKLPWQIFPGIFASIDSYSKKVTNVFWGKNDRLPQWFDGFGRGLERPVPTPHHSKFFVIDEETGIKLTGVPDEIIRRNDGSFFIVDYKTARFTNGQDKLLPVYEVQLNAYAYLGNRLGFSPVSGIGLIYYEPQTDLREDRVREVIATKGFSMPFQAKLLSLVLRPQELIPPLMRKAHDILRTIKPPMRASNCSDCERVAQLIKMV